MRLIYHRARFDSSSAAVTADTMVCAMVIRHCGADFMRLRLGVGHPGHKDDVTDYVLKNASREVEAAILKNVDEAANVMPLLADVGLNAAMKKLHTTE